MTVIFLLSSFIPWHGILWVIDQCTTIFSFERINISH